MFQPRGRRGRGGSLPLLLLATQVLQVGIEHIPPVTLGILAVNVAVFLDLGAPWGIYMPSIRSACLLPAAVVVRDANVTYL
jgi:hypothetical protein